MSASRMDRLIAAAAACKQCGKEHEPWDDPSRGRNMAPTWADRTDGHPYQPPTIDLDWLRQWAKENPA